MDLGKTAFILKRLYFCLILSFALILTQRLGRVEFLIRKSLGCVTEAGLFSSTSEGLDPLREKEASFKYQEVEVVALDQTEMKFEP